MKLPTYAPHPKSARNKKILPPIGAWVAPQETEDSLLVSKPLLPDPETEDDDETERHPLE